MTNIKWFLENFVISKGKVNSFNFNFLLCCKNEELNLHE